jgi:carbon storage regulator CsrA
MGMLCLGRFEWQSVVITLPDGRRGTVTVTEIRGGQAKLGFDLPRDCKVLRQEIQDRIDEERRQAPGGPTP